MSQASVDDVKTASADGGNGSFSQKENPAESKNEPNVRHIPIFIEGRDEPIFNRNISINSENVPQRPSPPINDAPQSIFSRVKNIPVRKPTAVNHEIPIPNVTRSESPARTIPIKVEHVQTKPKTNSGSNNNLSDTLKNQINDRSRSQSPKPKVMDSITKIQQIQNEIIDLMKKVEDFKATSRKDKEYIYLDEMLTQNLLKLDTIDTEGKENIKAARKEAINCINKCIAVLEAKVEQGEKEAGKKPIDGTNKCSQELEEQKSVENSEPNKTEGIVKAENEKLNEDKL